MCGHPVREKLNVGVWRVEDDLAYKVDGASGCKRTCHYGFQGC